MKKTNKGFGQIPEGRKQFLETLRNKKGEIPEGKKKVTNIVGYESDDPMWEKLIDDVGWGEMRGL